MHYISTRGNAPKLDFFEVMISGLAPDGGLYVPEEIPTFSQEEIASWVGLSYPELCEKIITPFVSDAFEPGVLREIIDRAYTPFRHKAIAPLTQTDTNEWILELYHGPTLAFKDFALQLLGQMFAYALPKRKRRVVIIGATSGDTGSAAIEGVRECRDNVTLFMMHPFNRVTEVQRRQMTSVIEPHIFNLAVETHFDDCQDIVKQLFIDPEFLPEEDYRLVAVNSINWARIMAQIVYYFYTALALGGPHREIAYTVPTGNFGDVYAGYMARAMSLPVKQLVVATNRNDILHRFFEDNDYSINEVTPSLSPSMDIQISSNFERLLYNIHDGDAEQVAKVMKQFRETRSLKVSNSAFARAKEIFASHSIDDAQTIEIMREIFETTGEVIDPHTAVGIGSARAARHDNDTPMVVLSTAHPAKFGGAVKDALGFEAALPHHLEDLLTREERYDVLPNDMEQIKAYIRERV